MRISIKVRSNGRIIPIHLEHGAKFGVLLDKISEAIGTRDFRVVRGATELTFPVTTDIDQMDIVEGERLFVETSVVTEWPTDLPAVSNEKLEAPQGTSKKEEKMEEDEQEDDEDEKEDEKGFRDRINRAVRDHMDDSGFSNDSLQSWSSAVSTGSEMQFSLRVPKAKARGRAADIISVLTTVLPQPNVSGLGTVFRITDNTRQMIDSFSIDQSNVAGVVANGLSKALLNSGVGTVTLPQVLQVRLLRNVLLKYLPASSAAQLAVTNRLNHGILRSKEVDQDYWKKKLLGDFGVPSRGGGVSYRQKYIEEASKRKEQRRNSGLSSPILLPQREPRPRVVPDPIRPMFPWEPRPDLPNPSLPYPHSPAPDPLQPIPDPFRPALPQPGHGNPFQPAPFGGVPAPWEPGHGELMPNHPPMPRGPRRLGGPGAQSPHNPFSQFNRDDFI